MKYIFSLFVFFLATLGVVQAQSITRGPYLQKPTPNSMVLRWRTDLPTDSRVQYGNSPTNLNNTVDDASSTTEHSIEVTGLSPNTTYYYSVGSTAGVLAGANTAHRFKTFPLPGSNQPIRAWVIGDFGKGNTEQRQVRDSYLNWPGMDQANIWLWLGDNAYQNGTDGDFQDHVFDSTAGYPQLFSWLPFYPTPGNHDYLNIAPPLTNISPLNHTGPYYDIIDVPTNGEAGGLASGTEAYYSYDLGNTHFVCLNSEIGCVVGSSNDWIGTYPFVNIFASPFTTSPFTDWLHADLSANTQRWTVVYFHQPPFTDGSHESGTFYEVFMRAMRENINPILYQYKVDLVLSGHSHVFERSYLITDHDDDPNTWDASTMLVDGSSGTDSIGEAYVKDLSQPDGEVGTVFVVCGNSASKDDDATLQYPAHYYGNGCDSCVGSFILDIDTDTLRGRYLKADGSIGDDFTIHKFGTATSVPEVAESFQGLETFPNPFGRSLTLRYLLQESGRVRLELMDLAGATRYWLLQEWQNQGAQEVTIRTDGLQLASGNYLLRLTLNGRVALRQVVKMKAD